MLQGLPQEALCLIHNDVKTEENNAICVTVGIIGNNNDSSLKNFVQSKKKIKIPLVFR